MKIAYVSHARYPTEKAYGVQMTRVCEALATLGHEVTLLAPDVHNEITTDCNTYYDVQSPFSVTYLPTKDALLSRWIPGRFAMMFTMRSYAQALRAHFAQVSYDLVYVRSPHVVQPALAAGVPVVLELHTLPRRGRSTFVQHCRRCALVVCLTGPMKDELVSWGVPKDRIIVEADAVDPDRFTQPGKFEAPLPKDRPIIGYVGSLKTLGNVEKGADMLLESAVHWAQTQHAFVWLVGGPDDMVRQYRALATELGLSANDIRIEGAVSAADVPAVIAACDVCVYPAPKSNHPYFRRDTSPLKLFEYLAAGVPTVCADIPPVRDIVDETSVWFFESGDPHALLRTVSTVLAHQDEAKAKARKGQQIAAYHTWKKRMQRVLSVVSEQ